MQFKNQTYYEQNGKFYRLVKSKDGEITTEQLKNNFGKIKIAKNSVTKNPLKVKGKRF